MSKTLILLRHANAQWAQTGESDHERSLSIQGENEAQTIGLDFANKKMNLSLIVTSSAVRARSTLAIAAKSGSWTGHQLVDETLYDTNPGRALEFIQALSDEGDAVMLVGHEPTWSALARKLTGRHVAFSTASMVCMRFNVSRWTDVLLDSGDILWQLHAARMQ